MFNRIINLISSDYNNKQIKKLLPIVKEINVFYEEYNTLTDDQIKDKTQEFRDRVAK
jgi:preprotein translocase subunit SecA